MKLIERIALAWKRAFSDDDHYEVRTGYLDPQYPGQAPARRDDYGRPVYLGPYRCWCNPDRKELESVHHRGYKVSA